MTTAPNTPKPDPSTTPNIVLTGFMGTGKTTVARLLAERLGRVAVDTDELIEQRHGAIADIFATHGEGRFRDLEREIAAELGRMDGLVVATGGGLLLDPHNVATFGSARIFCLSADIDQLVARLLGPDTPDRPLLRGPDPQTLIRDLLAERSSRYEAFETIDTTERTPDEVADEIVARVSAA